MLCLVMFRFLRSGTRQSSQVGISGEIHYVTRLHFISECQPANLPGLTYGFISYSTLIINGEAGNPLRLYKLAAGNGFGAHA